MSAIKELTPELDTFIDTWKDKPGNLIMVLHRVQQVYRYIPRDVAFLVAKKLGVPLAKIYGVMTFYHYFKLEKPGEHIISVCMGTACYLKGGEDLIKEIERTAHVKVNGTSDDGQFSLQAVRCIGCCGLAPALTVTTDNGLETFGCLTTDKIPAVIEKFAKK